MKECKICGAKYDVDIILLPDMDKDRINCTYCGNPLIEWKGAYMYIVRKNSGPTRAFGNKGLLAKCNRINAQKKRLKQKKSLPVLLKVI